MSLNFYAEVDNFKIDNKDNTNILLKAGSGNLSHQLDILRQLKDQQIVHIMVESAVINYQVKHDNESNQPTVVYEMINGKWTAEKSEEISLLDDNFYNEDEKITADQVDNFMLSQDYENDTGFNPKPILSMFSKGMDQKQIAEKMKMTQIEMMDKLDAARQHFAPYAAAWEQWKLDMEG